MDWTEKKPGDFASSSDVTTEALQDDYVLTNRQAVEHCKPKRQSQDVSFSNAKRIMEKNKIVLDIEQAVWRNHAVPNE